jgi:hypothetical protein
MAKRKAKGCDCKRQLEEMLSLHNSRLVGNILNPADVLIWTEKINSRKRGAAKVVIATFCPFCGEKINREKSALLKT